jgi:hypothetical protein
MSSYEELSKNALFQKPADKLNCCVLVCAAVVKRKKFIGFITDTSFCCLERNSSPLILFL